MSHKEFREFKKMNVPELFQKYFKENYVIFLCYFFIIRMCNAVCFTIKKECFLIYVIKIPMCSFKNLATLIGNNVETFIIDW